MKLRQRMETWLRRDDGAALMEMALIIPVFIAMIVGVANFGLVIQQNMTVVDSARAGAEAALLWGQQTNTSNMVGVANYVASGIPNYQATAANVCTCAPGSGVISCSSFCPSYGQPAMYAQVTATASLPLLFGAGGTVPVSYVARVRISCPSCY